MQNWIIEQSVKKRLLFRDLKKKEQLVIAAFGRKGAEEEEKGRELRRLAEEVGRMSERMRS